MTRHQTLLCKVLLGEIEGLDLPAAVRRLEELGLISRRAAERLAVRREVFRLARRGIPRCEALHIAAAKFSCSYEKARSLFYQTPKI